MRYFQKLLCLLILVLAASFGVGGCVLLYSDFSVQRSRMAAANAAAHAQACTLLQTEILDLQRRGISTGDAALTARVTAQGVPAALFRNHDLVCATLPWLQNFPLPRLPGSLPNCSGKTRSWSGAIRSCARSATTWKSPCPRQ